MILVVIMGVAAIGAFDSTTDLFIGAYILARLSIASLDVLYAFLLPKFRLSMLHYAGGTLLSSSMWFITLFMPNDALIPLWWAAIISGKTSSASEGEDTCVHCGVVC